MRFSILLLLLLAACGGGDNQGRVTIRFIHAVPDGTDVDIWVADRSSRLFQNVAYATATGFVSLEPGTYVFRVRTAGDPRTAPPLADTGEVDLSGDGGETYTIVVGGLASAPEADPDELRVDVYRHGFSSGSADDALVRLVHNAPGEPVLDVAVDGQAYDGLMPYTASDEAGIPVASMEAEQLSVIDDATAALLTTFTTRELERGGRYFVVFLGSLQAAPRDVEGFKYLVADRFGGFEIREQDPRLYLLNAVADSESVDVSYRGLDDEGAPVDPSMPLETTIFYRDLGGDAGLSVQLPPGEFELTVTAPGAVDPLGSALTGELVAGRQYLFTIGGRVDGSWPFSLVRAEEAFDRSALGTGAENRWRLVHAAPDLGALSFGTIVNTMFVPLAGFPEVLSYGDTSEAEGVDIGLDPFSLEIVSEDRSADYGTWDIVPVPDFLDFVVLLGSRDVPASPVQLSFVDTSTQPWTLAEQFPLGTPVEEEEEPAPE